MALVVGELLARLKLDDSEYNQRLGQAEKAGDRSAASIQSRFEALGKGVSTALGTAAGYIAGNLLTKLGGSLWEGATAGFKFNDSMEIVTAQLNAFTKDGNKSAEILEMIKRRAAETPFAFEDMAQAATALLPASKASGKGLEELIELAEILGASNPAEGLAGAAFSLKEALSGDFTSIIERFNLPRQRLNELKEQGVPALEAVRTAMLELGLDSDLVTGLAGTASGRLSTLQDTLVNLAAQASKPVFDAFSAGIAQVNTWLEANQPLLQRLADTLAAQIGGAITWLATTAIPAMMAAWVSLQPTLATVQAALAAAGQAFQDIWVQAQPLVALVVANIQPIMAGLAAMLLAVVVPAFWAWATAAYASATATITALAPVILPVLAIGAAVALLKAAWDNNWGGIQEKVAAVWAYLQPTFQQLASWLQATLTQALTTLATFWTTTLQPAIQRVWAWLNNPLFPTLQVLMTWLATTLTGALTTLAQFWTGTLQPALQAVWGFLDAYIIPILVALVQVYIAALMAAVRLLAQLWTQTLQPALQKVWAFIQDNVIPVLEAIGQAITTAVKPVLEELGRQLEGPIRSALDSFKSLVDGAAGGLDGVASAVGWVLDRLRDLQRKLDSMSLPDWMTPGSPTPWEWGLRGVRTHMGELARVEIPALDAALKSTAAPTTQGSGASTVRSSRDSWTFNYYYPPGTQARSLADEVALAQRLGGRI